MDNFAQKVEDALNEVNKLQQTTLEHAANISPLVFGRSIGVDIGYKEDLDNAHVIIHDLSKEHKNTINKSISPAKDTIQVNVASSQGKIEEFNSLQSLDFHAVNSSVLLREAEETRKRTIRHQIVEMQKKHLTIMQECLKPIEQQNQEERRKWLEKKRRSDSQILQKAEQQSAQDFKEHERQLETLRLQTQRQLQLISFQGIAQYQSRFRSKYEIIVNLLMSIDKAALMPCTEYNRKLKELIHMFEQLIGKIKCGDCGPTEMKTAENLCKSLTDLELSILEALKLEKERQENVLKEHQRKEREEVTATAEAVARQDAQRALQQTEAQSSQNVMTEEPPPPFPDTAVKVNPVNNNSAPVGNRPTNVTESQPLVSSQYVSPERLEFYTKINTFYQEKVERVKVLQSDDTMKKYRFDCQKSINIPINAISAVSPQHLQDKFDKLYSFVTSQPSLGRDYCVLLMAKKFVGQGETTISSNPQAAFPVASVIVSLWKQMPDFGQLFLAYVFKECAFLVPYFIPQKKNQSPEEYSKVLGFRLVDGHPEKQDMYLKRQAGIARLYAAVMVTNGRQQDSLSPHPYGLENAWRWLTNIIADLAPLPHLSATLIMEILQIVGSELWSNYGKQFVKLLIYIQQYYFPTLSEGEMGGPKARLEILLNNFLREGQIQKPSGMLPPGFW